MGQERSSADAAQIAAFLEHCSECPVAADPGGCAPIVKVIDYGIAKILDPGTAQGARR